MQIVARNVCHALPLGLDHLMSYGVAEPSRAGDVLVAPSPITTVYHAPWERVLFSAARDANPFFHLAESMWMLAGRNDAEYLDRFVHDFSLRFANDGILRGSYGHRWRKHWHMDQLVRIAQRLRSNPHDRQIVLGMWDPAVDLQGVPAKAHLQRDGIKDIPCNTHAYFRVREGKLDMTVCCRSNDIIWGAYGANAVHFSFLQEYMAARIGVEIGLYYQMSNNFHAYVSEIKRLEAKASNLFFGLFDNRYLSDKIPTIPLVDDPTTFDEEVVLVLNHANRGKMQNKFLSETVAPALRAHACWKSGRLPDTELSRIAAEDWRIACTEWITRRQQSRATRAEADKSPATTPGHT